MTTIIEKHQEFLIHLACSIVWHIHENETLSCLQDSRAALENASKTIIGLSWFKKNGHKKLNMELSWAEHFNACKKHGSTPIIYEKATKAFASLISSGRKKIDEFTFVSKIFEQAI